MLQYAGCLSSYRSTIACSGTEIDRASGAWSSLSCLYWDHVAGRALKRKGLQLLRLNTKRTNPIYLLRAGLHRWSFIGLSSIETLGEPSKIHLGLFGRKRKRQCWPSRTYENKQNTRPSIFGEKPVHPSCNTAPCLARGQTGGRRVERLD